MSYRSCNSQQRKVRDCRTKVYVSKCVMVGEGGTLIKVNSTTIPFISFEKYLVNVTRIICLLEYLKDTANFFTVFSKCCKMIKFVLFIWFLNVSVLFSA